MIKIEHPNLSQIVSLHTEACFSYVAPRMKFCVALFDALVNKKYTSIPKSIKDTFGVEAQTAKAIVKPFIKRKKKKIAIGEIKSAICSKDDSRFVTSSKKKRYKKLYEFFSAVQESLPSIISGNPKVLYDLISNECYKLQSDDEIKICIELIFNYSALVGGDLTLKNGDVWNNYLITGLLNISVCPYCNRSWVNTIKDQDSVKVTSPQLDHFFSQTDFPLLSLSFYNLIPSCETCNSRLKGDIEFKYDENLHPYVDGYGNDCRFETSPNDYLSIVGMGTNYDLELNIDCNVDAEKKQKVKENHKVFEIDTIYKDHLDIVSEIYRKKAISNDKYMEILIKQFPSAGLSKTELYRLAFGNYYEEVDFKKRPFAKLTRDTVEQLQLIKLK